MPSPRRRRISLRERLVAVVGLIALLVACAVASAVIGAVCTVLIIIPVCIIAGSVVSGAVAIFVVVLIGLAVLILITDERIARARIRHRIRARGAVLTGTAWLLPTEARKAYVEEWAAWLYDLRQEGTPWYRRLVELLSIVLIAAPKLAVMLRLGRRRVVD